MRSETWNNCHDTADSLFVLFTVGVVLVTVGIGWRQ